MKNIEADVVAVTDDKVRNARHAYSANTSYFDTKVGDIVRALEESGQLENTVVIVTAGHGDMLVVSRKWLKLSGGVISG